jgi:hypothetical protein
VIIFLKLSGQLITLQDWRKSSMYGPEIWIRETLRKGEADSHIALRLKSAIWQAHIIHDDPKDPLGYLRPIYLQIYGHTFPTYTEDQLPQAQQYIDEFLGKVNKLQAFL